MIFKLSFFEPVLTKGLSTLVWVQLISLLGVSSFGTFEYILATNGLIKSFCYFGLSSAFWKYINENDFSRLKSLSIINLSLLSLSTFIALYEWFELGILLLSEITFYFYFIYRLTLRLQGRDKAFLMLGVVHHLLVLLLLVTGWFVNVKGIVTLYSIINVVLGLFSLWKMRFAYIGSKVRLDYLIDYFHFAKGLLVYNLSANFKDWFFRYIIRIKLGNESLGYYSIFIKISGLIKLLFIEGFLLVFNPIRWRLLRQDSMRSMVISINTIFGSVLVLLVSAGVYFASSSFGLELLQWKFGEYEESFILLIPVLSLASLSQVRSIWFQHQDLTNYLAFGGLLSSASTLSLVIFNSSSVTIILVYLFSNTILFMTLFIHKQIVHKELELFFLGIGTTITVVLSIFFSSNILFLLLGCFAFVLLIRSKPISTLRLI